MNIVLDPNPPPQNRLDPAKFRDPDRTATGETRARVQLTALKTLWFNTGSLCNIECAHCYIRSGPKNDHLAYLTLAEVQGFLTEITQEALPVEEVGFTGGEPFMNPDFLDMVEACLEGGYSVLILTNAMQPMIRIGVRTRFAELNARFLGKITARVSLDHYRADTHDRERGPGSFTHALAGLSWLSENNFKINIAGRTCWGETEAEARAGYAKFASDYRIKIDADNPGELVLFPEMDETTDVAEITSDCWGILGVKASDMMCATSRMVIKRKGAETPTVLPCTLLTDDAAFEMGATLESAAHADDGNFAQGAVKLNHPHCARFCVLGGGSCTVSD